ncbi:electron transporter [Desulfosarcina widdelii]|uniref:Electron transporter n=1 Tax=Desulfosarcina widdelii TaxID=947919 RepID=A0A5K7ZAX2_9BACT|nr:(Fe-S)-binding protein [Desulfosarcina widdelii]BBO77885.1 electron transporter [Desulfosarcina widdelii]
MERIPYWNINFGILIDVLAVPVVVIFVYGIYKHWIRIRQGKVRVNPELSNTAGKIGPVYVHALLTKGILGTKIYKKIYTGVAHGGLFWGMCILFLGTVLVFFNVLFGLPVFRGEFNRWFMSFALDFSGCAVLGGIVFFLVRRLIFPPEWLTEPKSRSGFVPAVVLLGLVIISGFLVEGARIACNGPDPGSFIGNYLSAMFGKTDGWLLHRYAWWTHGILALGFLAYIPYSPLVHILLVPVNAALANPMPGTKMGVIDFSSFEDEESEEIPSLGASKLTDLSRKRLLDYSTCLWCGRCHEVCPAAGTGKPLSPKGVIVTLAEFLQECKEEEDSLIDSVTSDALFCCTTCAACMEACPALINQPKTILKLRQNLVMERSEIPELMGKANNSLELRGHPFFGTGAGPKDWCKDLEVPIFEKGKTDYLLWIGCSVTYEERTQQIARAMVRILTAGGISFGILEENRCTGDPAKQMGNEFLFTELAQQNIEDFSTLGIEKIITMCPHCFNSFKRHYPALGGNYEISPHSVFVKKLIAMGKLHLNRESKTICYHDPCYLGRRNSIFDDPRDVINSMGEIVEMPRNRSESFCCGGGGGNYWAEEVGTRINQVRAKEALDTGADLIATSCPFCLLMLTDGMKKFTEDQKVFDIAELVDLRL